MMNEMAENNDQNAGSDDDNDNDQSKATENERDDLVNVLQNNVSLSFGNIEGMSEEEKITIKNIIEITKHNLDEEVN